MHTNRAPILVGFAGLVLVAAGSACNRPSDSAVVSRMPPLRLAEPGVRSFARQMRLPRYPEASLEAGSEGVAVVRIVVGPDGRIVQHEVLQAPDSHIAAALGDALEGWVFEPIRPNDAPDGQEFLAASRLTFYFEIESGKGIVRDAMELLQDRMAVSGSEAGSGAGPANAAKVTRISRSEFEQRVDTAAVVLLDIRDRALYDQGHLEDAVNIPFDELFPRARFELPANRRVIIDCLRGLRDELCAAAAGMLSGGDFTRVDLLVKDH